MGKGSATPEKIDVVELEALLARPVSVQAIAARFHCTTRTVRNTAKRHGLTIPPQHRAPATRPPRPARYWQLGDADWLEERCAAGRSLESIAPEIGCSTSAVRQAAGRLGVTRRRAPHHPRLRDNAWLEQAYVERGLTIHAIAHELGTGHTAVHRALARAGIRRRPAGVAADPRLNDEAWLREQYVERGRSMPSIGAEIARSVSTVDGALRRHGIRRVPPPRPTDDRLITDWQLRRSVTALAGWYGASQARTELWLAEAGIFLRPRPQLSRPAAGRVASW